MATLSAMVEAPFNSDSLADTEPVASRSGEEAPNSVLLSPTSAVRSSRRVQRKKEERKECEGDETMLGSPVSQPLVSKPFDECVTRSDDSKKSRRVWEQWSSRDKTIFFEALGESGKNFEGIQTAFQARQKRKGLPLIKNKEQIRTFYYRSWHKIAKYLRFPDNIKKNTRELYGLINYGEMRKRLGEDCLGENRGAKLQELVFSGYTTVRLKGKTCRIKTPVCRALERLKKSSLGQKTDSSSLNLPETLLLHLKPLNASDFAYVHRQCFQNPLLSISIDLHVRLQSVIQMLQSKWSPSCFSFNTNNSIRLDSSPNQTLLTLHVPPEVQIRRPIIQSVEPLTSAKLSVSQIDKGGTNEECEECNIEHDIVTTSENGESSDVVEDVKEESNDVRMNAVAVSSSVEECEDSKRSCEELKRCWDMSTAGCLTMGELLLMCTDSSLHAKKELTLCYAVTDKTKEIGNSITFFSALARIAQVESQRLNSSASTQEQAPSVSNSTVAVDTKKVIKDNADKDSIASCSSQSSLTTFVFPTPSVINPPSGSRPMPVMPKDGDVSSQSSAQVEAFCRQMRELRKGRKGGRPPNRRSIISRRLLPVNPQPLLPASKVPIAAETNSSTINSTASRPAASDKKPQKVLGSEVTGVLDSVSEESSNAVREESTVASKSDLFLDSVLEPSNSSTSALLQLRKDSAPPSTPPTSPFRVASEEWLPDLSLSSLLGLSTEQSPSKTTGSRSVLNTPHHPLLSEDSVQSTGSEVDRQLLSMLNTENSVDFTMKFAKLAAHVSGNDN